MAAGSISAVSFARNFQSVPVSLIGIAFAVAAFPVWPRGREPATGRASRRLVRHERRARSPCSPCGGRASASGSSADRAIELFLGGEAFDDEDVATTTLLLVAFAISVPLESLTHLLARAIYSTRNTILPVIASLVGLGTIWVTLELLRDSQGLVAVPLAFAAGMAVRVVVLLRHPRLAGPGAPRGGLRALTRHDPGLAGVTHLVGRRASWAPR